MNMSLKKCLVLLGAVGISLLLIAAAGKFQYFRRPYADEGTVVPLKESGHEAKERAQAGPRLGLKVPTAQERQEYYRGQPSTPGQRLRDDR